MWQLPTLASLLQIEQMCQIQFVIDVQEAASVSKCTTYHLQFSWNLVREVFLHSRCCLESTHPHSYLQFFVRVYAVVKTTRSWTNIHCLLHGEYSRTRFWPTSIYIVIPENEPMSAVKSEFSDITPRPKAKIRTKDFQWRSLITGTDISIAPRLRTRNYKVNKTS